NLIQSLPDGRPPGLGCDPIASLSVRTVPKKEPAQLGPQAVPFSVKYCQTLVDPGVDAQVLGGQRRLIVEDVGHPPRQSHRSSISIPQSEIGIGSDHV